MTEKQIYEYIVEHCPYCALCGSTQNLHILHILYRSEGGPTSLWNLIRLCEKCHTKVHSSKRYWQPKLERFLRTVIIYECNYSKKIIEKILSVPYKYEDKN